MFIGVSVSVYLSVCLVCLSRWVHCLLCQRERWTLMMVTWLS